jgi:hypothetical protein
MIDEQEARDLGGGLLTGKYRNGETGRAQGLGAVIHGESKRIGHISCCGDAMMRMLLHEAAQSLLSVTKKWSWLKAWAMNVAKRRGRHRIGAPAGSDHPSHVERWHRVPLEEGGITNRRGSMSLILTR